MGSKKFTSEENAKIKEMADSGKSIIAIAKAFSGKYSYRQINNKITRMKREESEPVYTSAQEARGALIAKVKDKEVNIKFIAAVLDLEEKNGSYYRKNGKPILIGEMVRLYKSQYSLSPL